MLDADNEDISTLLATTLRLVNVLVVTVEILAKFAVMEDPVKDDNNAELTTILDPKSEEVPIVLVLMEDANNDGKLIVLATIELTVSEDVVVD